MITKKYLLLSILLVFIVSPLLAWGVVKLTYSLDMASTAPSQSVQPATKDELLNAAQKEIATKHEYSNLRVISIESFTHLEKWWYIATVKYAEYGKEQPLPAPMLFVKYYEGPDSIVVITAPNEPLPFYNISDSSGVPYGVIDKYNKAISEAQPFIEGER